MAPLTNEYLVHDAVGTNFEDLLDVMKIVDTLDQNRLVKTLPTSSSTAQTYHEWEYYAESRSTGGVAVTEGSDFSYDAQTNPTRAINYLETIDASYLISDDQATENALGGDVLAFRKKAALRRLMARMEFELIWASGNSGASNTARLMKGILTLMSKSTNSSAATLTYENWLKYLQEVYRDTEYGGLTAYMDISKKLNVDSFTTGVTKYLEAKDKRFINFVNVVETTFGIVELYDHRDLNGSGKVIIIDKEALAIAYKKKPYAIDNIAKTGHSEKFVYSTKLTLEARNPRAGIVVTNP